MSLVGIVQGNCQQGNYQGGGRPIIQEVFLLQPKNTHQKISKYRHFSCSVTFEASIWKIYLSHIMFIPAGIYLLKINNRNTRKRSEICSKLTIKIPERRLALS